nr:dehydroascorbate reductase 2 [Tanacetum cinerariifolium]
MPKINKSSSSTGEAIMICIDTSGWMQNKESPRFKEQAKAIRLYCTHKIKDFWWCCRGEELGVHPPKRMVVFAGGGGGGSASQESYSVAALSLSRRSLITPHVGASCRLLVQQESYSVIALSLSRSLLVQQQSSKLNAKAATSDPDSVNPVKIAAWSQSSLDLKLDANPNWETVTLDQKIATSSQSYLDLKLDNANPNWQPVTLDQNIAEWSQSSLDLKLDNANLNWHPETLDQKIAEWSQSSLDLKLDNANPNS